MFNPFARSNGYVLKQGSKTLSLMASTRSPSRYHHYVVCFDNPHTARKIQYFADPDLALRIQRGNEYNVTKDVSDALKAMRVPGPVDGADITLCTGSVLQVPKMRPRIGGVHHPMNNVGLHLHVMSMHDIFMMPFERNIGIVLPYDVLVEDEADILMACNIVDPCDDHEFIRWNLEKQQALDS